MQVETQSQNQLGHQLLKHETIGMQDMFLDLCASDTQVRNSVSKVSVNERVYFKQENGRIYVKNEAGKRLGMFSKSANNEWSSKLQNIQMAKVLAIVSRKKSDQSPEYQSRSKHETWEVPLIEVCILRNWNGFHATDHTHAKADIKGGEGVKNLTQLRVLSWSVKSQMRLIEFVVRIRIPTASSKR